MNFDYDFDSSSIYLSIIMFLFVMALVVFYLYCAWRLFVKAGKPGWAALIPYHDIVVQLEMIGRPGWWFFLFLIPVLNIVIGILMIFELAQVFGKDTAFGCLTIFFPYVMIPILALGDAKYLGPLDHTVSSPPAPPTKVA